MPNRRHNRLRRERWLLDWELADLYAQATKTSHDTRWLCRQEVRALRGETERLLAWARELLAVGRR